MATLTCSGDEILLNGNKIQVMLESYRLVKEEINLNISRYDSILSLVPTIAFGVVAYFRYIVNKPFLYQYVPFFLIGVAAVYAHAFLNIQFMAAYLEILRKNYPRGLEKMSLHGSTYG